MRMDIVGFLMLASLLFGGVLTVPEALAGFADPSVHIIAGLFVVGAGIFQTGLADRLGRLLGAAADGSARKLLILIMLGTAGLSAFLSSTGTVAVMIPVVATLARRSKISPSQLMIPLAFATLLGGLLTLIATPPNVVVSNALAKAGYEPFGFFDFTGPGVCLLIVGLGFILVFGPKLLPARGAAERSSPFPSEQELWTRYGLGEWIYELQVQPGSPLCEKTIAESAIRTRFGVGIFAIAHAGERDSHVERAQADHTLYALDHLTLRGAHEAVATFCEEMMLREVSRPPQLPNGLVAAELLLPPGSSFVGKTVAETRLRTRFDVNVIAVYRSTTVVQTSVASTPLSVGDLLLVVGTAKALRTLRDGSDAILVTETEELRQPDFRTHRAPHALVILLAMLLVMALEVASPVLVVIAAALAMVLAGCVEAESVDKTLNWESILLIATVLPLATALTNTGAIELLVRSLVRVLDGGSPYVVLSGLFAFTVLVGLFITNTATAVLVAPVAISLSRELGLAPHALLMTVAIASSSAFLTPVSSPVNMLVMNAGAYRFGDFAKLGAPLLVVIWLGTLLVVPWFFPF
jgi:di/tricarboxylate transporter